jgi:hypothetical protein
MGCGMRHGVRGEDGHPVSRHGHLDRDARPTPLDVILPPCHIPHAPCLAVALACALLGSVPTTAQTPAACPPGPHRTALRGAVGSAAVVGNATLWVYMKNAWWSGERAAHWFVNDDWDQEFRDQDKLGHALGGYHLTRIGADLLRVACVGDDRAIAWAAVYATLFQLQIEVWDGFYEKYGFSPGDMIANVAGAGLAVAQHYSPALRHVKPTLSYAPTAAYRNRAAFGPTGEMRPSLDYSGQTYWLSADVDALLPERLRAKWPGLLRASVGHSITDWVDPLSGATQRARRRIVFSLDLDLEKLPGSHPAWRRVKHELSYLRLPAPALEIYPRAKGIAWYR